MTEEINFELLNITVPELVNTYPLETQREIYNYLSELNDMHKIAYHIAFNHLGSSFNILRSNGFKEWKLSKISK
jgi:hypothetical protein